MTSSSLPDSSTCAEWTLNVTGPQRNALIRLWEQRATGSHLKGEAFRTAVFTRPYIHLVTYVMPLTHNIILTSLCSSVSMHTHHSTLLPAGPDHPAQLVYPNIDSSVGEDYCRDLPYHCRQCRDCFGMSPSSFISPQGTHANLSYK